MKRSLILQSSGGRWFYFILFSDNRFKSIIFTQEEKALRWEIICKVFVNFHRVWCSVKCPCYIAQQFKPFSNSTFNQKQWFFLSRIKILHTKKTFSNATILYNKENVIKIYKETKVFSILNHPPFAIRIKSMVLDGINYTDLEFRRNNSIILKHALSKGFNKLNLQGR